MTRTPFSWPVVGLVLLAIATAGLAFVALQGPSTPPGSGPQPTGSALDNPPKVSSKPSTEPADRRVPDVEPPLSLVDAGTAYRGTPGSCLGGATLERTVNGGRTWSQTEPPAQALLSLSAASSVVVQAVLADDSCVAAAWTTDTAGRQWSGPNPTIGRWFRLAQTSRKIASPSGSVPNPCKDPDQTVVELEGLTETSAAVLCEDGEVLTTLDGGVEWASASPVPGAVATAWVGQDLGWVLQVGGDACPGLQLLRSVDAGQNWETGGCVGGSEPPEGRPAVDFVDPLVGMALVGEETFTTDDGGLTWQVS